MLLLFVPRLHPPLSRQWGFDADKRACSHLHVGVHDAGRDGHAGRRRGWGATSRRHHELGAHVAGQGIGARAAGRAAASATTARTLTSRHLSVRC